MSHWEMRLRLTTMSLRKLSSDDISLHAFSSDAQANLKKTQTWAKEIASSTCVACQVFAVLTHEVHTTIDMSNQKKIIERLIKNNMKLHEDLKVLRIVWFKKIAKSEKIHSLLIVKIMIEAMMNQLMNVSMLNLYQECACKLFEKNCRITQCFRCHEFDHMIKFCRKNLRCKKCADKHYIEKCVMSLNRWRCINCNENHELWRHICFKWQQQMKQAFEIYKNRSFRYFEIFKYSHALFSLFLNSLDSMNSLDSTNSSGSMNSLDLDWSSSRVSNWHFEPESYSNRIAHIFNSIRVELSIFPTRRDSTRLGIESTRPDPPRTRAWRQEG